MGLVSDLIKSGVLDVENPLAEKVSIKVSKENLVRLQGGEAILIDNVLLKLKDESLGKNSLTESDCVIRDLKRDEI